jgi:hypothetical protein
MNAKNAKRIIGDHSDNIEDLELVLVGSNLPHAWFTHQCESEEIHEVTIQFHRDLFDEKFLKRNQLSFIRTLLERSSKGILFSPETAQALKHRFLNLHQKSGFDSVLELMSILHDLSISRNMRTLSNTSFRTTHYPTTVVVSKRHLSICSRIMTRISHSKKWQNW